MDDLTEAARFTSAAEGAGGTHWVEHLRVPALSLGTYSIGAGAVDDQTPHTEDEIYVVISGRAGFVSGGRRVEVGPGSTLFVPALEEHRFVDIAQDLTLVVVFAPAEGSLPVDVPHDEEQRREDRGQVAE
jgi:mannose-6-phosphate isomerase-like protein (cupin superfamily)